MYVFTPEPNVEVAPARLQRLSDREISAVLQRFLTAHAAAGRAVQVRLTDVSRVRATLSSDRDLSVVLCELLGAGLVGGDPGRAFWMRMVDGFLEMLRVHELQRGGPRRTCD